jgi:hypothetical protein
MIVWIIVNNVNFVTPFHELSAELPTTLFQYGFTGLEGFMSLL